VQKKLGSWVSVCARVRVNCSSGISDTVLRMSLISVSLSRVYDLRKYNFTNGVIPIWNSLSNHVVSAETVNTFKNRLDKFWSYQEVLYD